MCCIRNIHINCFKNTVFLFLGAPGYTCKTSCLQNHVLIKNCKLNNSLGLHRIARCTCHLILATLTGLELGGTALPHPASFTYLFKPLQVPAETWGSTCYRQVWGWQSSGGFGQSTVSLGPGSRFPNVSQRFSSQLQLTRR